MKLLIAADMEGITGVTHPDHTNQNHAEYQRFRRLMTADVNAAIQGASDAGVEEILVADGHGDGCNILLEELDPRAHLHSGVPSPFVMVQGIDSGVQAAFFIGYHARMGTPNAILDHTWASRNINNIWLNGRPAGEIGLNASTCGHFGVPVLLLSGDQSAAKEAQDWISGIGTAVVKIAASRHSAECFPLEVTQNLIREGARRAVQDYRAAKSSLPLKTSKPVLIGLEFVYTDMADRAMQMPWTTRIDGRRIDIEAPDMPAAYRAMIAAIVLANR
jgi:D-amino peptidase